MKLPTFAPISRRCAKSILANLNKPPLWSALMLHASALLILVTALLSAISASWLLFRQARSASKTLRRPGWALAISQCSAAVLVCAGAVFYTHYVPVLRALQSASTANPETLSDFVRTFQGLLYVPFTVSTSWVRGGSIYFWAGVVALCSYSALVRHCAHGFARADRETRCMKSLHARGAFTPHAKKVEILELSAGLSNRCRAQYISRDAADSSGASARELCYSCTRGTQNALALAPKSYFLTQVFPLVELHRQLFLIAPAVRRTSPDFLRVFSDSRRAEGEKNESDC